MYFHLESKPRHPGVVGEVVEGVEAASGPPAVVVVMAGCAVDVACMRAQYPLELLYQNVFKNSNHKILVREFFNQMQFRLNKKELSKEYNATGKEGCIFTECSSEIIFTLFLHLL